MKLLHVSHGYAPELSGGIETHLQSLLPDLGARGHDVTLVAGSHVPASEPTLEREDVDGVDVRRLHRDDLYFDLFSRLRHPGVSRLAEQLLDAERPDLLHVHSWIRTTGDWVALAARRGIPAVVTIHDLYPSCPRCFRVRRDGSTCLEPMSVERCRDCAPRFGHESARELDLSIELFARQYRSELTLAARRLVADGATRDVIAASTGLAPAAFDVVPFPATPRFAACERTPVEPDPGEPLRFGYWGSITDRKGLGVLLDAFGLARERYLERALELHLFGRVDTEELEAELHAKAAGLPVTFHGRFEYPELAAAGLHVGVFPMLCFETYGFVLDECYELGLPAIVTDIGSMTSRAGDAALRVPPGDADSLADALTQLASDPQLRARLRAAIPPVSLPRTTYLDRMEQLYEEARAAGPTQATDVAAIDWAQLWILQRESALAHGGAAGAPH